MGFLQTLFDANERDIKKYRRIVDKINALETGMQALSDDALRAKTEEFRQRVRESVGDVEDGRDRKELTAAVNHALDAVLPEAFAAVREAGSRTLGMRSSSAAWSSTTGASPS